MQGLAARANQEGHHRRHQGEEGNQQMTKAGQGEQDGGWGASPAGLQASDQESEIHKASSHG